jgi:hypothetical protein
MHVTCDMMLIGLPIERVLTPIKNLSSEVMIHSGLCSDFSRCDHGDDFKIQFSLHFSH